MDPAPARVRLDLETPRLHLRAWLPADTAWHRHLVGERTGRLPPADEDAATVRRVLDGARAHGVVPSVVVRRHDDVVVGYCGLVVGRATVDEPELAYELFARYHGQGYATEAAAAVVGAAARTGRARLWATVRSSNTASFRVLEKLGFARDRIEHDERGELVWNRLDLSRW